MTLKDVVLAESNEPLQVHSSGGLETAIWFKTHPVDRTFCYRVVQFQLVTDSRDQGSTRHTEEASWSWFEILVLADSAEEGERTTDAGGQAAWRSHYNNLGGGHYTRHFGKIFDRRHQLFTEIKLGDVIAVRICAGQYGWKNDARSGRLIARYLDQHVFFPHPWSLSPLSTSGDDKEQTGVYSVTSSDSCLVRAPRPGIGTLGRINSRIWFTTPPLDDQIIEKLNEVTLVTNAHSRYPTRQTDRMTLLMQAVRSLEGYQSPSLPQEIAAEMGIWTWFDLVILPNAESITPKKKNGRLLEWKSHAIPIGTGDGSLQVGQKFGRDHELISSLETGDVIGVRVCAQFAGWENHAHSGRLSLSLTPEAPPRSPLPQGERWDHVEKGLHQLGEVVDNLLKRAGAGNKRPAFYIERDQLISPLRADEVGTFDASKRPLRLLSLDGGGVRGISALCILKEIWEDVTERE
ncbi:unnamed protein product [Somion occarium]|uniref:Uncharacterized protein n=1 Tax=Somion occarium TaxID=3059160 RepID=A0ABP1CQN0_9APHY